MSPIRTALVLILALACQLAGACAHDRPAAAPPSPDATAATAPASSPTISRRPGVVEVSGRTLVFEPTRDDVTVGCAVFSTGSSRPVRINGVEVTDPFYQVYLKRVGTNRFALPAMTIEHPGDESGQIFCLSVKVWFEQATNNSDGSLYKRLDDRYALAAWSTIPPEQANDTWFKARFSQNRVETLEQFNDAISRPIAIRLGATPLKPEWAYPEVQNHNRRVSAADLTDVQRVVRDRGERYLVSVYADDADHAHVEASIDDATRYHGTRTYKLVRKDGGWQVEAVVERPNPVK